MCGPCGMSEMCKDCTQNPNAEEYGMTKEEQLQKDLELQAETIGYLRERIAELEEKLERKECGNKLLADKLEDVTKVKIELEQKLEQIKDEKFGKALSQIKHDREVVIEYNERLQKENTELKEQLKTSYRKGMRHMAKALKDYDRTDGAWTDYFEHTVDKVLQRELVDFEENGTLADQLTKVKELQAQIEKMKADVMANIKWADKNCDNMWQKLVKMWNQWEIKEND